MTQKPVKIVFSAGESSGDQHAASMFTHLKQHLPAVQGLGMGAAKMREAGIDVRVDSSAIGVIGLVEILRHYGEIRAALTAMKQLLQDERPDLLVCVDYKEFNLKLARFAKQIGIKVLFYVSPQVWAWRPGRVVTYGKAIDMMAVIFPFETPYYEKQGVPVRYVGHPSVDKVKPLRSREDDFDLFGLDAQKPVVGLLPGSRVNEIRRLLPLMLDAAVLLKQRIGDVQFVLPQADSIADTVLAPYLEACDLNIKVIKSQPYDVIQCADALMTASGTASLEIALLQVPMVIVYKLSMLTYWLGRMLVNIPFIGLPNIVAARAVVKELIQHEANAQALADETWRLLQDADYRQRILHDLAEVKAKLGAGGGSENMARLACEMLGSPED